MAQVAQQTTPQFEIAIENEARFVQAIERARAGVSDLTQPLTQIGFMLSQSAKGIFALRGPGLYDDLSPAYKKKKLARWGSVYPILKASGRLEASLTDPSGADAVLEVVNKDTLYWGTRVPYAIFHQSLESRHRIPWRPFLIWGSDSRFAPDIASYRENRAKNILNNYVLRQLGADVGPVDRES